MKRRICKIIAVLLVLSVLAPAASARELTGDEEYRFIHELVTFIHDNAKFPEDENVLLDKALEKRLKDPESGFNGMVDAILSSLDEHSSYLSEEEYASFISHNVEGAYEGVGLTISITNGKFVIISALPDSPAARAGICPGDILTAINDENIEAADFETVKEKIRGEIGTPVKITVRRGAESLSFTMPRESVKDADVTYEIMEGIGYIRLTNFTQGAVTDFKAALTEFDKHGIKKLIVDIRDNPGGEMQAALDICRLFTPKGVLMRVEFSDPKKKQLYFNNDDNKGKYDLAVLVNEGSASASELFAGGVQDTKSGKIIGVTTYGKGTVQKIFKIASGGAVRLTIAEYKTAGNRSVHHVGVMPDIPVENTTYVPDSSYMSEMDMTHEWQSGDVGAGVLAVEERLAFFGYLDKADDVADTDTTLALQLFQVQNGLAATGRADVYTQIRLHDADYNQEKENDDQLKRALEYLHANG